jgi:hypothetical protein
MCNVRLQFFGHKKVWFINEICLLFVNIRILLFSAKIEKWKLTLEAKWSEINLAFMQKILYYTKWYSRIYIKNLISEYLILIKKSLSRNKYYCHMYIDLSPLLLKMCLMKTELVCKCLCKKKLILTKKRI